MTLAEIILSWLYATTVVGASTLREVTTLPRVEYRVWYLETFVWGGA